MLRFKQFLEEQILLLEDRISFIKEKYGKQILDALARSGATGFDSDYIVGYIVDRLASFDPTHNKAYTQWLVTLYIKAPALLDNFGEVGTNLAIFDRVKQRMPADQRDINRFKSAEELATAVAPYADTISGREAKKRESEKHRADTELIYDGPEGMVVSPKTEDASCFWGKGTKWCTASSESMNYFHNYNNRGKLYIFLCNDNRKYQFHMETGHFCDEQDHQIPNVQQWMQKYHPLYKKFISHVHLNAEQVAKILTTADTITFKFIQPFIDNRVLKLLLNNNEDPQTIISRSRVLKDNVPHLAAAVDRLVVEYIQTMSNTKLLQWFEASSYRIVEDYGKYLSDSQWKTLLGNDLPTVCGVVRACEAVSLLKRSLLKTFTSQAISKLLQIQRVDHRSFEEIIFVFKSVFDKSDIAKIYEGLSPGDITATRIMADAGFPPPSGWGQKWIEKAEHVAKVIRFNIAPLATDRFQTSEQRLANTVFDQMYGHIVFSSREIEHTLWEVLVGLHYLDDNVQARLQKAVITQIEKAVKPYVNKRAFIAIDDYDTLRTLLTKLNINLRMLPNFSRLLSLAYHRAQEQTSGRIGYENIKKADVDHYTIGQLFSTIVRQMTQK